MADDVEQPPALSDTDDAALNRVWDARGAGYSSGWRARQAGLPISSLEGPNVENARRGWRDCDAQKAKSPGTKSPAA